MPARWSAPGLWFPQCAPGQPVLTRLGMVLLLAREWIGRYGGAAPCLPHRYCSVFHPWATSFSVADNLSATDLRLLLSNAASVSPNSYLRRVGLAGRLEQLPHRQWRSTILPFPRPTPCGCVCPQIAGSYHSVPFWLPHSCNNSFSKPWHPSNTSRQVDSKSSVYHGSATLPGRVVWSIRRDILPA